MTPRLQAHAMASKIGAKDKIDFQQEPHTDLLDPGFAAAPETPYLGIKENDSKMEKKKVLRYRRKSSPAGGQNMGVHHQALNIDLLFGVHPVIDKSHMFETHDGSARK